MEPSLDPEVIDTAVIDTAVIGTAVIIPVKSFDLAKGRLASAIDGEERAALAQSMATGVVRAASPLPVFVVCGSNAVAEWALRIGAGVIWYEPPGLNPSVSFATSTLQGDGYKKAIVAHGDLPLATSLSWVADFDGVTIVPDRRGEGTNVMALPLGTDFCFQYGSGSSALHQAEAKRLDLPLRIEFDDALGWDIDTPTDLADLPGGHPKQ